MSARSPGMVGDLFARRAVTELKVDVQEFGMQLFCAVRVGSAKGAEGGHERAEYAPVQTDKRYEWEIASPRDVLQDPADPSPGPLQDRNFCNRVHEGHGCSGCEQARMAREKSCYASEG